MSTEMGKIEPVAFLCAWNGMSHLTKEQHTRRNLRVPLESVREHAARLHGLVDDLLAEF